MTFQSLKENNHPQIWIQEMKIVDYLMIGATIRIAERFFVSRMRDFIFLHSLAYWFFLVFLICLKHDYFDSFSFFSLFFSVLFSSCWFFLVFFYVLNKTILKALVLLIFFQFFLVLL